MAEKTHAGKLAVVTGGTRGIGRAVVEELRARGADVIATGTNAAGDLPAGCRYVRLVLEDARSVETMCALIAREAPHILINNAGVSAPGAIDDLDMDEVARVHDINLVAPLHLCRAALKGMTGHGWGRIVNLTAVSGIWGRKGRANYGSSKAGLDGMTASIAAEYGPHGVLANCVAPGFIETDVLRALYSAEQLKALADTVPVRRLGTAQAVAALVVWLAGTENTYVTAQNIVIDGGFGRAR